jgi:hypothetical protein
LDTDVPVVEEIDVRWAIAFVRHEMKVLRVVASEGALTGDEAKRKATLLDSLRTRYFEVDPKHWPDAMKNLCTRCYELSGGINFSGISRLIHNRAGWNATAVSLSRYRSVTELLKAALGELVDSGDLITAVVNDPDAKVNANKQMKVYWLPEFYPYEI